MRKPRVVLSSCGTSILTNQANGELRSLINKLANYKESKLPASEKQRLDKHIKERKTLLQSTEDLNAIKSLSAELNGIITYYGGNLRSRGGVPDHHFLVVSDTYLGKRVGETVQSWLEVQGFNVQTLRFSGFVTNDHESFRSAMTQLIKWCEETLKGYQDKGFNIAFNLTGGFKSAQGFLQTIGMFYADESFYIFETGTLLTIPRLPIKLDTDNILEHHLDAFRQLGLGEPLSSTKVTGIPETLLFEVEEDSHILSEWGELVWQRSKEKFYGKDLLEPLPGISYSHTFRKSVEKQNLTPNHLDILNKRIDQLSLVVQNKGENLQSLDFKALKGNPRPPSTHECDIWAGDERRLFGHFENESFIIDGIGRGLH